MEDVAQTGKIPSRPLRVSEGQADAYETVAARTTARNSGTSFELGAGGFPQNAGMGAAGDNGQPRRDVATDERGRTDAREVDPHRRQYDGHGDHSRDKGQEVILVVLLRAMCAGRCSCNVNKGEWQEGSGRVVGRVFRLRGWRSTSWGVESSCVRKWMLSCAVYGEWGDGRDHYFC